MINYINFFSCRLTKHYLDTAVTKGVDLTGLLGTEVSQWGPRVEPR